MNSGGVKKGSPKRSPERAQTAAPWTQTRRYGCQKPVELRRQAIDDIDTYPSWSKYGDNNKTMGRSRVFQDFGRIIDVPGPGEYNGKPELLSTEETMPKYTIGQRYPALVIGEKDALSTPNPKYVLPSAVQLKESQTFAYRIPFHPMAEYKGHSPSLVKYSPKHTIDSTYERFTAAVMPKRHRSVQPRKVIDLRNLTITDDYLKRDTMDPGLYNQDIFKKDPREKIKAITMGTRIKETHPEGIDFIRPGPGYHDPDSGLFGRTPLGKGVAHPRAVSLRRKDVVYSQYSSPAPNGEVKTVKGTWVDTSSRRQEARKTNYSSDCSFDKKPPEKKRATGKNMHSTVQTMQYHFIGRQSPGTMRFSPKKY